MLYVPNPPNKNIDKELVFSLILQDKIVQTKKDVAIRGKQIFLSNASTVKRKKEAVILIQISNSNPSYSI